MDPCPDKVSLTPGFRAARRHNKQRNESDMDVLDVARRRFDLGKRSRGRQMGLRRV